MMAHKILATCLVILVIAIVVRSFLDDDVEKVNFWVGVSIVVAYAGSISTGLICSLYIIWCS